MTTDLPQDLSDRSPQPSPDASPPLPADVRAVPDRGLGPRSGPPKRVLIMGAGLAGLVAAYELKRQGHDVVVLEAQNRVGGRIYTLRTFAPGGDPAIDINVIMAPVAGAFRTELDAPGRFCGF